jgi:hypothetical protein
MEVKVEKHRDTTVPTMSKTRGKGQPRIVGKGRLRKRNTKLEHGIAFRGMTGEQFAMAFRGLKRHRSA